MSLYKWQRDPVLITPKINVIVWWIKAKNSPNEIEEDIWIFTAQATTDTAVLEKGSLKNGPKGWQCRALISLAGNDILKINRVHLCFIALLGLLSLLSPLTLDPSNYKIGILGEKNYQLCRP